MKVIPRSETLFGNENKTTNTPKSNLSSRIPTHFGIANRIDPKRVWLIQTNRVESVASKQLCRQN
jgi:hypothetical protein